MRCFLNVLVLSLVLICLRTPRARAAAEPAFREGTWTVQAYAAYFDDVSPSNEKVGSASAGVGYFISDDWSLSLEGVAYKLDAKFGFDDAAAGGVSVDLRYFFWHQDRLSLFAEVGGGMLYADEKFPPGGTQFNFTGQAGVGAAYRLDDSVYLLAGARYFHLSNANIHGLDENPSIDSIGGYVGVMFTF